MKAGHDRWAQYCNPCQGGCVLHPQGRGWLIPRAFRFTNEGWRYLNKAMESTRIALEFYRQGNTWQAAHYRREANRFLGYAYEERANEEGSV